jgi:hypothetical protein
MDNYAQLIRDMADAFLAAVRVLETENAQLRSDLELLGIELAETQARTDFWEEFIDEKEREEATS